MSFPTLRYPRLCRLLTYIVVLGVFIAPIVIVANLSFVPGIVKLLVAMGLMLGLLVYIGKEFPTLMAMDIALAMLSCQRTARTQYRLPESCTPERVARRVCRYGKGYAPAPIRPQPDALRCRFSAPWTVASRGIERVVATYHTATLDAESYRAIFSSGNTNSAALTDRKKALFLDKQQKKAPLNRVTVLLIFAQRVDPRLNLYELVCKQAGDEFESCVLPCVIDLSQRLCFFNSLRLPYVGFGYAAKNRGLRMIRRLVFGGRLPLQDNRWHVPIKDKIALDQSLWQFWKGLRQEFRGTLRGMEKQLRRMRDGDILLQDDMLYLKWGEKGIALAAAQNAEEKTLLLEPIDSWLYPKNRPIAKKTIQAIKQAIAGHFQAEGWAITYDIPQDES